MNCNLDNGPIDRDYSCPRNAATATEREINFLIRELNLSDCDQILDLACGFGRHCNILAKLRYNVTGVDINSAALATAKDAARKLSINVKYVNADLSEFCVPYEYDKAYLLYAYLDFEQNKGILENVSKSLKKGGTFCFNVWNKLYPFEKFNPSLLNGLVPVSSQRTDIYQDTVLEKIYHCGNILVKQSSYEICSITYEVNEIKSILKEAGFTLLKGFSDFDSSPITQDSKRIILLVKK